MVWSGDAYNPLQRQKLLITHWVQPILCHLCQQDTAIIDHMEAIFRVCGPPTEKLIDNDTAFHSKSFRDYLNEWRVGLWFHCSHVPSGMTSRIAMRKQCSIQWYKVTPPKKWRVATDCLCQYDPSAASLTKRNWYNTPEPKQQHIGYEVGDHIWVNDLNRWCTSLYKLGCITGITSPKNILINGMNRHVRAYVPVQALLSFQCARTINIWDTSSSGAYY